MMRRLVLLMLVFVLAFASNSNALESGLKSNQMELFDDAQDRVVQFDGHVGFTRDDPDTIYFGGDDGTGKAFVDGIWDFDTIVSDPFQGWTSVDRTQNIGDYFARVTAQDFVDGGDLCSPMIEGTIGQLWVGIHEDAANLRDFVAGMGYQNNMCQSAFTPLLGIDPVADNLNINFDYFNDTEIDFDYTFIYVQCFDAAGEPLTDNPEVEIEYLSGILGTYQAPVNYDYTVSAGILPAATEQVKVELRMWADGGYSDEDGDWDTVCGPFAADDVAITVGATTHSYNFDADDEGWTFSACIGKGKFMAISDPADYIGWLADQGLECACALNGYALQFCDVANSPFDPPGHPVGYEERAFSGTVVRGPYQPPEYNSALFSWTDFSFMPQNRGSFYRPGYRYFPYTTEVNPVPHWSPRLGQDTWWHTGDDPRCGGNVYNLSTCQGLAGIPMPAAWDSMQVVYEITTDSAGFGHPQLPDEGNNAGTPIIDDVRFFLTGSADAPVITYGGAGESWMDGFGQNYPLYLEPSDVGDANVTTDLSGPEDPNENNWLGDSATIAGPTVVPSDPLTQWKVELCFQLTHVGPRQNLNPDYLAWKNRLSGDPEMEFVCVLMDSMQKLICAGKLPEVDILILILQMIYYYKVEGREIW